MPDFQAMKLRNFQVMFLEQIGPRENKVFFYQALQVLKTWKHLVFLNRISSRNVKVFLSKILKLSTSKIFFVAI